jgi:chromosome condensin MukBEF complex kleisin-like MukF subunit
LRGADRQHGTINCKFAIKCVESRVHAAAGRSPGTGHAFQVEINEGEMDSILASVKRGKEPPARVAKIQARNAVHKKHTERLEQVLRALDNEAISLEQVDNLKEGIEDYLVRLHMDTRPC